MCDCMCMGLSLRKPRDVSKHRNEVRCATERWSMCNISGLPTKSSRHPYSFETKV